VVHRLTSSFTVGYQLSEKEPEDRKQRQVVDIGLNVKNFGIKCHVPGFVVFVEDTQEEEEKREPKKDDKRRGDDKN
jgi:hypothetical protein